MAESILGSVEQQKSTNGSIFDPLYSSSKIMIIVLNSSFQAGTWKTAATFTERARFILFNYHSGDGNSNLTYLKADVQGTGAHNWGSGTRYMWYLAGGTILNIGNGESSGTLSNEVVFVCF